MGRYTARVGKYYAEMGNWVYDYLKQKQREEYYQDYKFSVEVKDLTTGKKYDYEIPVLENFVKIEKLRKNYEWNYIDKNCLFEWLFNSIIKKEELYIKVQLNTHWGQYPTNYKSYYLQSNLYKDVILAENDVNNIIEIKDIGDLKWVWSKGLDITWVDKNGEEFKRKKDE